MPADPHQADPEVHHEPEMVEGEEAPPRHLALMSVLRWALLGLAALVAVFSWWSYALAQSHGPQSGHRAVKYHCPMHPQIVSDEPGECPICHMTLELIASSRSASPAAPEPNAPGPNPRTAPKPAEEPASTLPVGAVPITLTLDRIQSIGVRTAPVDSADASPKLQATAVVEATEQGAAEVHVRSAGFVEKIVLNQTGVAVRAGQPLFALYSPEIFQAESEVIASAGWGADGEATSTQTSARSKLALLGVSPKQIEQIARTKEPVRAILVSAPQAGYVTKKNIVAGSYVTPEMPLYEIQDLSRVYVVANVSQQDVAYLHPGLEGTFTPNLRKGEAVLAKVDLVYPTMNAESRTTRVRMIVRSPRAAPFRPGEFGTVELSGPARHELTVPRDAVIDTGLATYVFLAEPEGRFFPRTVVLGPERGEKLVIVSGVTAGDRVVSGATFLIDAECRLSAAAAPAAEKATVPR